MRGWMSAKAFVKTADYTQNCLHSRFLTNLFKPDVWQVDDDAAAASASAKKQGLDENYNRMFAGSPSYVAGNDQLSSRRIKKQDIWSCNLSVWLTTQPQSFFTRFFYQAIQAGS